MIDIAASHRQRIGCSKIAQVLGLSRYGTPYQLWEQYTGKAPWPNLSNQLRVALGEPMEEVLRPHVEKRLGRKLYRDRKEYLHPKIPLIGHLDYRASIIYGETIPPPTDIKTSLGWGARYRFGDDETDQVDDDVRLQMQGYTLLTGANLSFVSALVPGPELKIYTVHADLEWHALIEEGISSFWWHVQNDVPPECQTLSDAARRWAQSTLGKTITADAETFAIVEDLRAIEERIKADKADLDALKLALQTRMGDAEALINQDGKSLCTWKSQKTSRLDIDAIKAAGLYETYATTTESRVFRLKK